MEISLDLIVTSIKKTLWTVYTTLDNSQQQLVRVLLSIGHWPLSIDRCPQSVIQLVE